MFSTPIYMDYSATTPVDPRVAAKMIPYLTEHFGNPASRSHVFGWTAEKAVEDAREEVARLVNCDPKEIIWTSGATESNNLAIKGAAHFYKGKGKHLITMKTEHKAVIDTMRELEREGFEVTYLDPQPNGLLDWDKFKAALRPDTILVSIMHVNNEIGVIQDIAALGEVCREKGILFHVDAAQSTGKVAIDRLIAHRLKQGDVGRHQGDLQQRGPDRHRRRHVEQIDQRRHHHEAAAHPHDARQRTDGEADDQRRKHADVQPRGAELHLERQAVDPGMGVQLAPRAHRVTPAQPRPGAFHHHQAAERAEQHDVG